MYSRSLIITFGDFGIHYTEDDVAAVMFCKMFTVQCTIYSVQCTVYSVQYTVYSVQCTVYSWQPIGKIPKVGSLQAGDSWPRLHPLPATLGGQDQRMETTSFILETSRERKTLVAWQHCSPESFFFICSGKVSRNSDKLSRQNKFILSKKRFQTNVNILDCLKNIHFLWKHFENSGQRSRKYDVFFHVKQVSNTHDYFR